MKRSMSGAVAFGLLVAACSGGTGGDSTDLPTTVGTAVETATTIVDDEVPTTEPGEPIQPGSLVGWRSSTPEEQGIDSIALAEVVDHP